MADSVHNLISELPPTALTIFGATGDLSLDYLFPAITHLDNAGLLLKSFRLIGVGRRPMDDKAFREFIKTEFRTRGRRIPTPSTLAKIFYYQADFNDPNSFAGLTKALADHTGKDRAVCYNRLYYFATLPNYFEPLSKTLKKSGLLMGCSDHDRTIRVLIEKPFGFDLKSSRSLNKALLTFFKEEQVYRIDHYLGKETVQNLLIARFANSLFEPTWNKNFVDHIEVSAMYDEFIGKRAEFYDKTGAIRDVLQNHVLQMLALIVMERPKSLNTEDIRDAKVRALKHFRPFDAKSIGKLVVRGQYGTQDKEIGYAESLGRPSNTETFVALKAFVDNNRWKGVPIYIRTGMRLARKVTEISIHYKKHQNELFIPGSVNPNVLTFRIQPNERVSLQMNSKIPGFGLRLHKASLDFGYQAFNLEIPAAYERLLLDFMQGDQRLFIRSDEIEAAWKFVDSIRSNWGRLPLHMYAPFSEGPKASEELITRDNREWWTR